MHSRRSTLAATAGVLTAGALPTMASSRQSTAGQVVFTYDDGPIEDYTTAFRVHRKYGVPGCSAVCSDLIGSSEEYLDRSHVREMVEDGWEIMSHTVSHRALGYVSLESDCEPEDKRIHVSSNIHGQFEGDPIALVEIASEREITTSTVTDRGEDDEGEFLSLASPIGEAVTSDGIAVRYPESFLRKILSESRARIEELGVPVTGFVYPFGRSDGIAERLVSEYYKAVPNYRTGRGGLNSIEGLEPTELTRRYIESDKTSGDEIEEFMEAVATEDSLGIVGGHTQYETLTAGRIEHAIQSALDNNLEIVTLETALENAGVLETASRSSTGSGSQNTTTQSQNNTTQPDQPTKERESRIDSTTVGLFAGAASLGAAVAGYLRYSR